MEHVPDVSAMDERGLDEHIERWHEELWLATKHEHAEDHKRRRQFHIHDGRPYRLDRPEQIEIVNASGMDADTLYRHVIARHPELCYGEKNPRPVAAPAKLRYLHAESHRLIPLVLGHFHEAESEVGVRSRRDWPFLTDLANQVASLTRSGQGARRGYETWPPLWQQRIPSPWPSGGQGNSGLTGRPRSGRPASSQRAGRVR